MALGCVTVQGAGRLACWRGRDALEPAASWRWSGLMSGLQETSLCVRPWGSLLVRSCTLRSCDSPPGPRAGGVDPLAADPTADRHRSTANSNGGDTIRCAPCGLHVTIALKIGGKLVLRL
jgi:hypothetical protein